ncbi:hypothetical protein LTR08_004033 [Meristemomyces frigidus]|nr:hypothetical protein LTR08_004033 [Meristemomyces frigidus]
MNPSQGRMAPPPGADSGSQRGQPPTRPDRPGDAPSVGRFPVRPQQQQQYARPMLPPPPRSPPDRNENLYDGSAYGESDYEQNEQWPLPSRPVAQEQVRSNGAPNNARRPPQRPQRPDYQQPIQEPSRVRVAPANKQYHPPPPPPSHHGSGQWTDDGYSSPSGDYISSDLAYQQGSQQQGVPSQAVKRPPLGPPPSSRRGPASYYPQIAPVHPIVEETDSVRGSIRNASILGAGHDSMKSYASSNAIPIGIPDYYLEQRDSIPSLPGAERPISSPDSEYDYGDSLYESPDPGYGSEGRSEGIARPEPVMIVRQASLGRKSKPTLTNVKSSEKVRRISAGDGLTTLPSQQRTGSNAHEMTPAMTKDVGQSKEMMAFSDSEAESDDETSTGRFGNGDKALEAGGAAGLAAAVMAAPVYVQASRSKDSLSLRSQHNDPLSSGTGLIDSSSVESEQELKKKSSRELLGAAFPKMMHQQRSREPSPLANEVDPRMMEILGGLEKGGALSSSQNEKLKTPTGGLSERAGKRRPARLNVDTVKEAEARGSLTSLPDLIQRATRLASNLDRGKTASRLGTHWFDGTRDADDEKLDKRRSGSISDMLASFPPPGLATPTGSRTSRRRSAMQHSQLISESDAGEIRNKREKRCCGLPLWVFLLLLVMLILLIAAAIILPVVLIVIPRQNGSDSDSTSDSALSACQAKLTCQNGGANVITTSSACQCLCVNGYTGSTCSTASDAACTTTSVGSTSDATVGNAIPRLLTSASSDFNVPLDGEAVLGLFSSADLSCSSENALVTFNNNAGAKRGLDVVRPTPTLQRRQTATSDGQSGAATSNGIVFETGSPTVATSSGSATSTSSSPSSTSSASSDAGNGTDSSTSLDFARVAVLYIFQVSGQLNDAITAQTNLQSYFTNGETSSGQSIDPANVTLGNGYTCDLSGHSLNLANGTTIGSGSSSR